MISKEIFCTLISFTLLIHSVTARPHPKDDINLLSTMPITNSSNDTNVEGLRYKIAIISDLDKESKRTNDKDEVVWVSYLRLGSLLYNEDERSIQINWTDTPIRLISKNNFKGRGMELSELIKYNGHLLSFDDRTGIVYQIDIDKSEPIAWITLMDGDGNTQKPFKTEWASVKDHKLYVGSTGNEWINQKTKTISSYNPMFIKRIQSNGDIEHVDWYEQYDAMRNALNLSFPGFIWHEAGVWSDVHNEWFFLPRKCSEKLFDRNTEERLSCSLLIRADENFKNVNATHLTALGSAHGYSSFKFVPNTNDSVIVALSTKEIGGQGMQSYISAFTIDGEVIMKEEQISSNKKYEGIEFI